MSVWFYEPNMFSLDEFDRLFDDAFNARVPAHAGQVQRRQDVSAPAAPRMLKPRMDLHEDPKSNVVTATFELPGLTKEHVNIDVHNNNLTISGESKLSEDRDESGWAVKERRFGKFSRTLRLPEGVQPDQVKASMEHGVLTVTFPKSTPETAPKKITIA
ncbi:hypothetical protein JAAARDRAFT_133718 [Jaapia argillacea MUCL 33604]|uniref:Uncharacterized protein n=1 Tax=Jaapia argillacea MUCL 33604 TaxID=933084 RepID=A0A067PLR4_9AGAM|nr:hypothetical protein JAAARDRAFT_133718 [Jaapia argillacea MUCL 33604]